MWWPNEEEFVSDEEPSKHKQDIRLIKKLFPYFRPYLKRIAVAAFLLLSSTILTLTGPVLVKHAIDYELPDRDFRGLIVISLLYLIVQVIVILVRYFQQLAISITGEQAIADLKFDLFSHILKLPVAYFDKNPVGRLITRVEGDTETLKHLFSSTAVVLAQDFAFLIGMSVIMMIIDIRLYLLIVVLVPAFFYGFWWFSRTVRPIYLKLRRILAEMNSFIMESIQSLGLIQVFNQERNFFNKINRMGKDKFKLEMKAQGFWYRIWFLVDLGEIIGIMLVLGFGGAWALKGMVSIGTLFLFISYISRLFEPLRGLSDQLNLIERAFASSERVFGILSMAPEQTQKEKEELTAFHTGIRFDTVRFAYEEEDWILSNLDFMIKKGEKIALVGETGGGKTSVISLLLKFYEPQQGRIFVDDHELSDLKRESLRSKISLVPQDVILFPGTILENLRLFNRDIPLEKVYESAKRARIHQRIMSLPDGYQTNIIEQGINLSFGERQLLSFARALVFDPEIVILDEATSSVDPQTEALVQEGMKELLRDRTAIIIAHRLATTQLADRVFVIHKGRLVEQGRHDELIAKKGYYYNLYRLQYLRSVE